MVAGDFNIKSSTDLYFMQSGSEQVWERSQLDKSERTWICCAQSKLERMSPQPHLHAGSDAHKGFGARVFFPRPAVLRVPSTALMDFDALEVMEERQDRAWIMVKRLEELAHLSLPSEDDNAEASEASGADSATGSRKSGQLGQPSGDQPETPLLAGSPTTGERTPQRRAAKPPPAGIPPGPVPPLPGGLAALSQFGFGAPEEFCPCQPPPRLTPPPAGEPSHAPRQTSRIQTTDAYNGKKR